MSNFPNIKEGLVSIEALEKELNLKQLQITRLLNITQAINNNVTAVDLFAMYESFLSWEMGVKKMALFFRNEDAFRCCASIGIPKVLLVKDISDKLPTYTRLLNLEETEHPLIKEFNVVIPVAHKEIPLAYVFIGGFGEKEDMYNKVQLITAITNIVGVAIENKRLFNRQIEQKRLNREMELATDMQRMLIPMELPKGKGYELASIYKPHLNVGGDYYDFIEFPEEDTVAFCIGDISGKGLAAALLMANFQANFHSLISRRIPLEEFIQLLNSAVLKITKGDRFITFFVAQFNRTTRKLTYINAGHNPPAIVK
ncbi:MAG: sigma-B regulation protein RsbU (phosphoserine phosphatase), partial [Saprospiraceae bacterium]